MASTVLRRFYSLRAASLYHPIVGSGTQFRTSGACAEYATDTEIFVDVGHAGVSKSSVTVERDSEAEKREEAIISARAGPNVALYGEDAVFVVEPNAFGVADGVGGWKKHGVNPAEFASQLMRGCAERLSNIDLSRATGPALRHVLGAALTGAHRHIREASPAGEILGGSTACVAIVDPTAALFCGASIGDSGWRIFRGHEVIAESQEQRHSVFTPWQLSKGLPGMNVVDDNPDEADVQVHQLQPGDVIVVATDGLWDNMYDNEIAEVLAAHASTCTAEEIAAELVDATIPLMMQKNIVSPFSSRACDEGVFVMGGKVDDTAICVAKIY